MEMVDAFWGAGGFSAGAMAAGCRVIAGIDCNPVRQAQCSTAGVQTPHYCVAGGGGGATTVWRLTKSHEASM